MYCKHCGKSIPSNSTYCPECGKPLDSGSVSFPNNKKKSNRNLIIICVAVFFVAMAIAAVFFAKAKAEEQARLDALEESKAIEESIAESQAAENARNEYILALNDFLSVTYEGMSLSAGVFDITYAVWGDTLFQEYNEDTADYTMTNGSFNDDFNTSLQNLYDSYEMTLVLTEIEENSTAVKEIYKSLQNPTDEFSECFEIIDKIYDVYIQAALMALTPSGSYDTYYDDCDAYVTDYSAYCDKLTLLIPAE